MDAPRTIARGALTLAVLFAGGTVSAQESPSYKLRESVFNAGGDPSQGSFGSSPSFRIRFDAIGDAVAETVLTSASFRMDPGFVSARRPPGEVFDLRFTGKEALVWGPERSVGSYNLYRDPIGTLPGAFGSCLQAGLPTETATDASSPPPGGSWFYLVTAENRLAEEGTKGAGSSCQERPNPAPCP